MIKICGFTGYRKLPFGSDESHPDHSQLRSLLRNEIQTAVKDGYTHFISGFALGTDTYFAEEVLAIHNLYPYIKLEAALACEAQPDYWPRKDQEKFHRLLSQCDKVTYVSRKYYKDCYLARNRYIVRKSHRLIAVYDGKSGGTMYTVNKAKAKKIELRVINPSTLVAGKYVND